MKINYNKLIEAAHLEVVKKIFKQISEGTGAFTNEIYITFITKPVNLSSSLRKMYPENMSLLICNNYSALDATAESITISMNFATGVENLIIPFPALSQFIDKTNEFALNFTPVQKTNIVSNDGKIIQFDFNK